LLKLEPNKSFDIDPTSIALIIAMKTKQILYRHTARHKPSYGKHREAKTHCFCWLGTKQCGSKKHKRQDGSLSMFCDKHDACVMINCAGYRCKLPISNKTKMYCKGCYRHYRIRQQSKNYQVQEVEALEGEVYPWYEDQDKIDAVYSWTTEQNDVFATDLLMNLKSKAGLPTNAAAEVGPNTTTMPCRETQ